MPINSKQKGNQGEREFAKLLQKHGYEARRGQQFCGLNGEPDVVSSLTGYHFEIKRVEKLNIYTAVEQSKRDARDGERPIVAHRRNRKEWLITMPADVFFEMVKDERH